MGIWAKLGLTVLAAAAVYSAFRKPPPPPPDTAVSATEVKGMLNTLLYYSERVCFEVPDLPQGRLSNPGPLSTVVAPGGRRPYLEDLVKAGVLVHVLNERAADVSEDFPLIETIRVAPEYKQDYEWGGLGKGRLCFAKLKVESVQSVQRVAPGSRDHRVNFRYKVSEVSDWVRRLPPEALGDAQAWLATPQRDGSTAFCFGNKGARILFGTTCSNASVEDDPARFIRTGPQPRDNKAAWEHWKQAAAPSASASAP